MNTHAREHQPPLVAPGRVRARPNPQPAVVALLLAVITMIVYSNLLRSDFAYYDDEYYVTTNSHVKQGLSWQGVAWAFTSVGYEDNWHPVTWLSHMLDVQLFGLDPAWHHLTNLIFHVVATLLLFGFLRYATGRLWASACVAALFAVHPLHVESVAWVAERKDVLSAAFWFASLWAYVLYVRRPGIGRYAVVVALFALGLLAKPMVVTLPVVLLLLDYWPLGRVATGGRTIRSLLMEKLPLVLLTAASSVITVIAQRGAIVGIVRHPLSARIANAVTSYGVYLEQLFWPRKLAVFYPHTPAKTAHVLASAALLAAITSAIVWAGRERKHLVTGWLWYLVTLVPVIGIVQVGSQDHADRYTYLPYVGIFVMIAWELASFADRASIAGRLLLRTTVLAALAVLAARAWEQVGYWENGTTLFSHAIAVTERNDMAHYMLANVRMEAGRADEAITHYRVALEINPRRAGALVNLANAYVQTGQPAAALPLLQMALALARDAGDETLVRDTLYNVDVVKNAIARKKFVPLSERPPSTGR